MGDSNSALQQIHADIAADRGILLSSADLNTISAIHAVAPRPTGRQITAALASMIGDPRLTSAVLTYLVPPLWRFRDDRCDLPIESWRPLFEGCAYTHDFEVARRPLRWRPYTLYRGATIENRFGMSWTGDIDQARYFARSRQAPGAHGAVWQCRVPANLVLARVCAMSWEDEYVSDVRGCDVTRID